MKFFKKSEDQQHEFIIEELRQKISSAHMPPPVAKISEQELELLSRISPSSAEYTIGITYIDYLVSRPWNRKTGTPRSVGRIARR